MAEMSIYKKIKEIIVKDGQLPADFSLETEEFANGIKFAPGAKEGVLRHHSSGQGGSSIFPKTLKGYMSKPEAFALKHFEDKEADDFSTATEGKVILNYIQLHKQDFPAQKLFSMAHFFVLNGTKPESVKLGLMLMRLFRLQPKEIAKVKDSLVTLGYYEDFTGYVLDNMMYWDNDARQEILFDYAQKLNGWGKINVMGLLEADTEEKKSWILKHGCKNSVMCNYLAMTCAAKSGIYERLAEGNLSDEEMIGVRDIIGGLVEDGPAASLADLKNPSGLIVAYFLQLKGKALDIETIDLLYGIKLYFETRELEKADTIAAMVDELVASMNVNVMIKDALPEKTFLCLRISSLRNEDLSEELYELLRNDFTKYFRYSTYILIKDTKTEDFFDLCDLNIKEEDYPVGMGDLQIFKPENEKALPLDIVVQYLDKFPNKGKKMIKICLNSPVIRWRNVAAKALLGWEDELSKKLSNIDEELYNMVVDVNGKEVSKLTKEMLMKMVL